MSNSEVDSKLAEMSAKMAAREAEIKQRMEEMRSERGSNKTSEENYATFADKFEQERLAISNELQHLRADTPGLSNQLGVINDRITTLQRYHSDSIGFLPAYISASAQSKTEELLTQLTQTRNRLQPKKKFAFSGRAATNRQQQQLQPTAPTATPAPPPSSSSSSSSVVDQKPLVTGITGGSWQPSDLAAVANTDVLITHMQSCEIQLLSHPATLHLTDCTDCTILCGPVHRSVLIERCTNCTFVLACQQLRLHTSTNSTLYLHVTSQPIIEDCTSICVAPYSLQYDQLLHHYADTGLNQGRNLWDRVNDFNFLATSAHSPNWGLLPDNQRKSWQF